VPIAIILLHNRGSHQRGGQQAVSLTAAQSGEVPCSGARRDGTRPNEVSAAIPGGEAAGNVMLSGARLWRVRWSYLLSAFSFMQTFLA